MAQAIRLIVGLGNPTPRYEKTRHNAGFWFLEALTRRLGAVLRADPKFHGDVARYDTPQGPVYLLRPVTYMNRSGLAVAAIASFYKIRPDEILVAHDELDLPVGAVRLKKGGGHGGHNGLRDMVAQLASPDFYRLRLGIGHPGDRLEVANYVLHEPSVSDLNVIQSAIADALAESEAMIKGDMSAVMNRLNGAARKSKKKVDVTE